MIGLNPSSCIGSLVIGTSPAVTMNTYAWLLPDLRELWLPGLLPENVLKVDVAQGDRPLTLYRTTAHHSLPLLITGEMTSTGTIITGGIASVEAQLAANIKYLETNLAPPSTATDTLAASLTVPGEMTARTANVHVLGITPVRWYDRLLDARLELSIPDGRFT